MQDKSIEKITNLMDELQKAVSEYNKTREQGAPLMVAATVWSHKKEIMVRNAPKDWSKYMFESGGGTYSKTVNGVELWEVFHEAERGA